MSGSGTQVTARILAISAVLTLFSACASIPFSTLWKLRSFNGNDLKTLKPEDIRIVVKLPDRIKLEPDKTTLNVTLTPKDKNQTVIHETGGLMLLSQGRSVPADVPAAHQGETWYLMKLNQESISSFKQFQQQLEPDMKQHYKSLSFRVDVKLSKDSLIEAQRLRITIWLRMTKEQGYFELLDNAPLTFKVGNKSNEHQPAPH